MSHFSVTPVFAIFCQVTRSSINFIGENDEMIRLESSGRMVAWGYDNEDGEHDPEIVWAEITIDPRRVLLDISDHMYHDILVNCTWDWWRYLNYVVGE